jgi:hypothetical protein
MNQFTLKEGVAVLEDHERDGRAHGFVRNITDAVLEPIHNPPAQTFAPGESKYGFEVEMRDMFPLEYALAH